MYLAATLAMTWPLATDLTRSLPADLGDSLLNNWILAWGSEHLARLLSGELRAAASWWNGNIFHPAPLALAYSEHLAALVVQVAPVYWFTGNILLGYNLLFLSTFVLSGLGTFLWIRELTGNPRVALVAGLLYAFAPYRIAQFTHLQILSSQWMPFALFAFRRYFDTGSRRALAGAVAATVAQNLSCGYYLLFFAPFLGLYCAWEITERRRWHELGLVASLASAALVIVAATYPFLTPYLDVRQYGISPRSLDEVKGFSADVYSYLTASPGNRVWGTRFQVFPHAEGELFPGVLVPMLAVVGVIARVRKLWREPPPPHDDEPGRVLPPWRSFLTAVTATACLLAAGRLVLVLLTGGLYERLGPVTIKVRSVNATAVLTLAAFAALVWLSPRVRRIARGVPRSPLAFFTAAAVLAVVLSWGPVIHVRGRPIKSWTPYRVLHDHVPGFDGLRVPARYGMLAALFLTVPAAFGLAAVERRTVHGGLALSAMAGFFLLEATAAPIALNQVWGEAGVAAPPPRVLVNERRPRVYAFVETLPPGAAVAEFPFGYASWELRYVFYAASHLRPILNGYSGGFPPKYIQLADILRRPLDRPDYAWEELRRARATHVIVHRRAFLDRDAAGVERWLESSGARRIAPFGDDVVFELPR